MILPVLAFLISVCLCSSRDARCGTQAGFESTKEYFSRINCDAVISDSPTENKCAWLWLSCIVVYGILFVIYSIKIYFNIRRN